MLPEETAITRIEAPPGGPVHVFMSGRLGWDVDVKIKKELALRLEDDWSCRGIVLDLAEIRFVDSAGISSLLALRRQLGESNGNLALCRVPPRIRQMFELVGLYRLIPAVGDVADVPVEALP